MLNSLKLFPCSRMVSLRALSDSVDGNWVAKTPVLQSSDFDKSPDSRQHYLENRANLLEKNRLYRLQNRDELLEKKRLYYIENKSRILEKDRRYYFQNRDKLFEKNHHYYFQNRAKLVEDKRQSYLRNHKNLSSYSPRTIPRNSWKNPEVARKYFSSIANQLHISTPSDWYRVSRTQIAGLGVKKFGNLGGALQFAFPEIAWDLSRFSVRKKKSGQRWLKVLIEELVPGIEIIEDYQHPELSWEKSNNLMELDLWIPKYQIGIEFQGEQHYYNLDNAFGPNAAATLYSDRDMAKLLACQARRITLIVIPCWWDGLKDSLSATLYQTRPDVFPESNSSPIPTEMPSSTIESIG